MTSDEGLEEIIIQPYEWVSSDRDDNACIRIWTHNRESKRVLLRVEDYEPFCRLELPLFVEGRKVRWEIESLKVYVAWLRNVLSDSNHVPTSISYDELEPIYMYRGGIKYPYLTLKFASEDALRHATNVVNSKPYYIQNLGLIKANIYEKGISTYHRLVTDLKVGYGQWLRVKAQRVNRLDEISSNELEYIASYKDIVGVSSEESKSWITEPTIAAVDIECNSHNQRAMPNRLFIQDCPFMISYIVQKMNHPETRKNYLLVLGDCNDIPDAIIQKYKTEVDMINGLGDLIQKTDPSVILGYNIYKFDFPYLDARMNLYLREWNNFGLIKDQKTFVNTKTWKSSAYGMMSISTLEAEGRLSIDMFPIVKRDHKLDRYTLDFVCKHFLKRGKHDMSAREMFQIYGRYQAEAGYDYTGTVSEKTLDDMSKVGLYNLEDSVLCIDLFEKLNTWIAMIELSSIVAVPLLHIFTRGQQLRVQNQVYQFAYRDGFVLNERISNKSKFVGGHVVEPVTGKHKNVLIFDFASLYPSIIQAYNICYSTLVPAESTIPDEHCHVLEWEDKVDVKGDPNKKFDIVHHRYRFIKKEYYHGILPRMCEHLVKARKAVRAQISPYNDAVTNIVLDQRQAGLKVSANSIFGSLGVTEGGKMPLPEGAASITAMGRFLAGKAAKYVEETYNWKVVYGDTDSIMVSANITDPHDCETIGNKLSKEISAMFPSPLKMEFERALAIGFFIKKKKYCGIKMANIIKNDNPKRGPLLVVNSVEEIQFDPMFKYKNLRLWKLVYTETNYGEDKIETVYIGVPSNIILTMEQPYYSGIPLTVLKEEVDMKDEKGNPVHDDNGEIVKKKITRYGAPDMKNVLKKGVVIARRDNCLWLRQVYLKVLVNILFDYEMTDTLDMVDSSIMNMMSRSVPILDMSITREIGKAYAANSHFPLKIFVDELHKLNTPVEPGDRIDYFFVRCSEPARNEKQGWKMRIHPHFWQNYQNEPLDTLHYVEKILKNPIEQILYLGYKDEIDAIEKRCKPPVLRRGKVYTYMSKTYINIWVKMLKLKEDMTQHIKLIKPGFPRYEPWRLSTFSDEPMNLPPNQDQFLNATTAQMEQWMLYRKANNYYGKN
jgi:DNA polymerase elongation subunit (family B)